MDLVDLFERGTAWTASKIPDAADQLGDPTPCEDWDVRDLLNHTIDSQRYFAAAARGAQAQLPNPSPPALIGDDPVAAYDATRTETVRAYLEPGVLEKAGPGLGLAFVDQLVHGWDLANATGQDSTMPDDLARAAFAMVDGRLTADQRGAAFKPEIAIPENASPQEKLLAYTGRRP